MLKPADVHDALAYAYDHLHEIEADLSADDEEAIKARLRNANPSSTVVAGSGVFGKFFRRDGGVFW